MPRDIDAFTSATLKHLRERWWDATFTEFLRDTLQPRAGKRILDVGCGTGTAEVSFGLLGLSQVRLFAVDLLTPRVTQARAEAAAHNVRVGYATADACALPFRDRVFDSTFCVAVLQHVRDLDQAIGEFARVTRLGGRVLVVEPDNSTRYWYSSCESGFRAFEVGSQFFAASAEARGDRPDATVGPTIPSRFLQHGIEPRSVRLFPVAVSRLGCPPPAVWQARRAAIRAAIDQAPTQPIRRLGEEYAQRLERYAEDAKAAGGAFVEIQNTTLFATEGQRVDAS